MVRIATPLMAAEARSCPHCRLPRAAACRNCLGGTAHTFWNLRPDPARYVLVMGARTFALIQAIHATDDRSPDRMRRLYAGYGATLLG